MPQEPLSWYDGLGTSSVAFPELPKPLTHPQDNTVPAKPLHTQTAPCRATDSVPPPRMHVSRHTSAGGLQQALASEASPASYSSRHQAHGLPPPTQNSGSTSQHSEPLWAQHHTHRPDTILSRARLLFPILPVPAKPCPPTLEHKLESQGAAEGQAYPMLSPTQAGTGHLVWECTSQHTETPRHRII